MGYRLSPTTMAGELRLPPPYTGSYPIGELEDVPVGPVEQLGDAALTATATISAGAAVTEVTGASLAATATVTASGLAGLIVDDFSSYPLTSWAEGSTHGPWNVEFLGGGSAIPVDVSGNRVIQYESAVPTGTQTFAALLYSTVSTTGDVTIQARARTLTQLRATSPNGWESVWLGWNYTQPVTGQRRFYYIALKPNGFELGKVDQSTALPGGQRFLWTDSTAFSLGTWYQVKIQQTGARIQVWVDGTQRADFTDGVGSGGTPAWGTTGETVMTSGATVLYEEDSRVQVDDVEVVGTQASGAPASGASLTATATIGAGGAVTELAGASLAATATTTAAGAVTRITGATLTASAAVTAAAAVTRPSGASLAGTATIAAAATQVATSGAALTGAASIAAAAAVTRITGASLAGTATVTAAGFVVRPSGAALVATASISTAGFAVRPSAASLAVTATITATPLGGAVVTGQATLTVTATITAVGRVVSDWCAPVDGTTQGATLTSGATLTTTASITAAGYLAESAAASLTGTATITTVGLLVAPAGAALAATATITTAEVAGLFGQTSLLVAATIAAAAVVAPAITPLTYPLHAGLIVDNVGRSHAGLVAFAAGLHAGLIVDNVGRSRAGLVVDNAAPRHAGQLVTAGGRWHAGTP